MFHAYSIFTHIGLFIYSILLYNYCDGALADQVQLLGSVKHLESMSGVIS